MKYNLVVGIIIIAFLFSTGIHETNVWLEFVCFTGAFLCMFKWIEAYKEWRQGRKCEHSWTKRNVDAGAWWYVCTKCRGLKR